MFPVNSSLSWRLPSLRRVPSVRFPAFADTTETLRHPALHTGRLWFRCPAPALPSFASCFRSRAPAGPEVVRSGQGHFAAGVPHSGSSRADNAGLLRFPAGPSHTYAVLQDPGRIEMSSPLAAIPMLPPHPTQRRLRQAHDFVANTRPQCLLSMLHERRYRRPCKTGFRLAGSPLPGGSRTL